MLKKFTTIILCTLLASCSESESSLGEPTDWFINPESRYGIKYEAPHIDHYSVIGTEGNKLHSLYLRPIGLYLEVPKQHLVLVSHPYMPWAKKIWDKATLEVLLPDFEHRDEHNKSKFSEKYSTEVLTYRIGFLSRDSNFIGEASGDKYLKEKDSEFENLIAFKNYKKYGDQTDIDISKRAPRLFMVEKGYMLTPAGNPIFIKCGTYWGGSHLDVTGCRVSFVIPRDRWPKEEIIKFGGTRGVEVTYEFSSKYLYMWEDIHRKIISLTQSYIKKPEIFL
jgi:hypothetical protein